MSDSIAPGEVVGRPPWTTWFPVLVRAPLMTPRQWRVLLLVSLATTFDQYDRSLFAMALPQIQASLGITEGQVGYLGSIVRLGALPALAMTMMADRLGRRRVLLFTILAYTLLTGASALARDAETFVMLQFLARAFGTAEILLAVVVLSEELAPEHRGWGVGALFGIQSVGVGLAALLLPLVETTPDGWRWLYAVGLLPMLVLAWLRRSLPETQRFEAQHQPPAVSLAFRDWLTPARDLMGAYPGRLAAVMVAVFALSAGGAAADFLGPKYLREAHGWTAAQMTFLYLIGGAIGILGSVVAGRLGDRVGRRPVAIGFGLAITLLAAAFYNVSGPALVPIWICMIFALIGNEVIIATFGAEMFPTSHRSTAAGARMVVATVGGGLGLAAESLLYDATGSHWTAVTILLALVLVCPLVVAACFPETSGLDLDEIAPER